MLLLKQPVDGKTKEKKKEIITKILNYKNDLTTGELIALATNEGFKAGLQAKDKHYS
ncbi:MAG: hypothetical protein ACYCSQ_00310 [bacterium]